MRPTREDSASAPSLPVFGPAPVCRPATTRGFHRKPGRIPLPIGQAQLVDDSKNPIPAVSRNPLPVFSLDREPVRLDQVQETPPMKSQIATLSKDVIYYGLAHSASRFVVIFTAPIMTRVLQSFRLWGDRSHRHHKRRS